MEREKIKQQEKERLEQEKTEAQLAREKVEMEEEKLRQEQEESASGEPRIPRKSRFVSSGGKIERFFILKYF